MEVNKDNFYAVVEEKSASKLVLVDCYTDWRVWMETGAGGRAGMV